MQIFKTILPIAFIVILLTNCKKPIEEATKEVGKITFNFEHIVSGDSLVFDSMMYINAANNPYSITDLMYFISDVTLYKSDGKIKLINEWEDIHYVDPTYPESLTWNVYDDIEVGNYDSITFTFGISKEKNESFLFVNPPESFMMWPDILGGGYHYLIMNGLWKNASSQISGYNFHLGIGQLYHGIAAEPDSIYAFVHNDFKVRFSNSAFSIKKDERKQITLQMDIDSWFESPQIFDFNVWGGSIMQNQPAMDMGAKNGFDVFSILIN